MPDATWLDDAVEDALNIEFGDIDLEKIQWPDLDKFDWSDIVYPWNDNVEA